MLERLPPELIAVVIAYLKANPLTLAQLELVSRSWFRVFSSQRVWGRVDPYFGGNSRRDFIDRVSSMPAGEKEDLRLYWMRKPIPGSPINCNNLDLLLAYHFYTKKKALITNKAIALVGLNISGKTYMVCSDQLRRDKEIIDKVMGIDVRMVHEFPPEYLQDRSYIEPAVRVMGSLIKFASPQLQDDKSLALLAVDNYDPMHTRTRGYSPLRYLSDRLKTDRDVVLTAVKRSGQALALASSKLRSDPVIVNAALQQTALAFIYIEGPKTQYFLPALQRSSSVEEVKFLFTQWSEVRKHPSLIEAMLREFPESIAFVPKEFQNRRDVVLAVVKNYGAGLQFACRELQLDPEIVKLACKSNPASLKFAARCFLADRDLVLAAVKVDGTVLKQATLFQNDAEIVAEAVKQSPASARYASPRLAQACPSPELTATEWDVEKMMIAKGMEDLFAALNY